MLNTIFDLEIQIGACERAIMHYIDRGWRQHLRQIWRLQDDLIRYRNRRDQLLAETPF